MIFNKGVELDQQVYEEVKRLIYNGPQITGSEN